MWGRVAIRPRKIKFETKHSKKRDVDVLVADLSRIGYSVERRTASDATLKLAGASREG